MDFQQGKTDVLDGRWICQCAETMFENVQYIIKLKEKILMITMKYEEIYNES